jgi:hypothetical protein
MKRTESLQPLSKRGKAEDKAEFKSMPAQVDRVVTRIIRTLRRGHPARLPGLGTLNPGKPWTFDPERTEPSHER